MSTPDAVSTQVAANIRAARKEAGLTLEQVAQRAAGGDLLRLNTLSRIERGDREISIRELYAIAGALGVAPASLLPDQPPAGRDDSRAWRVGSRHGIHIYAVNDGGDDEPLATALRPEVAAQIVAEHNGTTATRD
jgi:transcriptional regulator with XRE-family HTH domain